MDAAAAGSSLAKAEVSRYLSKKSASSAELACVREGDGALWFEECKGEAMLVERRGRGADEVVGEGREEGGQSQQECAR